MRGLRTDPERLEVRMLVGRARWRGGRVLEIGGGDGRLTRRIAGTARAVVGVDPDGERIARAKRLIPARHRGRIQFEGGSGEERRLSAPPFRLVLFSRSL